MSLRLLTFISSSAKTSKLVMKQYDKSLFLLLKYCHIHSKSGQKERHLRIPSFLKVTLPATYTVEAAVVLPVFLCLTVFTLFFFRILVVQWGIQSALHETTREYALCAQSKEAGGPAVVGVLAAKTAGSIRTKKVPSDMIRFGVAGISYMDSKVDKKNIDLVVAYDMPVPIRLFGDKQWHILQRSKVRKWNGYNPHEQEDGRRGVYVTQTGSAYHKNIACVYLNPSIKTISGGQLNELRSKGGGKYYRCARCRPSKEGVLYVTDYGDVYHGSVACSSLKRTTKRVTMDAAKASGHHACSKCSR